jgi:hypothetical protein
MYYISTVVNEIDVWNPNKRPTKIIIECGNIAEAFHVYFKASGDKKFTELFMSSAKPKVDSGKYIADVMSGDEFLSWLT